MLKIPKPAETPEMPVLLTLPTPRKIKQIITVIKPAKDRVYFDNEVNGYLRNNWKLERRDIITPHGEDTEPLLYAELVKESAGPMVIEKCGV